ncbi:glutamine synthetase [Cryobacterium glaciale]|uniref:glutamine synthetase n=1 Tax=Cryobacterium glaciale TaxID=1259145 RepID=A0A4V6QG85_9MICO|nr:glutamine synthetase family protein [Cryobacterium glaciale]TFB71838.1 glutamine synthetase [Cryobacterium glaciale]
MTFETMITSALTDREAFARHREANMEPGIVADLEQRIAAAGVEYIYYMLPTIGAKVVAKMVPARHLRRNLSKGIALHRTAVADLQSDRFGNLIGGGIAAREMVGLPDPETFVVLPWDTSVARMFCRAYEPPHLPEVGGQPLATDSRGLLMRAHAEFTARTGLEVRSGCEPEMSWVGPGLDVIKKEGASPAYQVENLERMRPIYKKLVPYAQAFGLDMIEGDYEDDGQLELNWMYDRVELTSDRLVTYRQICKQVAREEGVTASFMPKPATGQMGNGCHHNLSLWQGDVNVLIEPGNTDLHLSEIGRHAVGGMLTHAASTTAIMAPTVNSYKRFWDAGQFAPSVATWGLDSRASMIRISSIGRMEYRLPDASVNPYLSHTALIAAMEDGINRRIDPGAPLGEPGTAVTFTELPLNLGDAIKSFQLSDLMSTALPADYHDIFIQLKEDEWARFSGVVTDWERAMYWETLP